MPRIPSRPIPLDLNDLNERVAQEERQEVAQAQEEAATALVSEQSFYADSVVDDPEVRPRLKALRQQVLQIRNTPTRDVVAKGLPPQLLQAADLQVLREAYDFFHARYPETALAHDLEAAWAGSVQSRLSSARQTLTALAKMAQEVNRGGLHPQTFFDAWDKGCHRLRGVAAPQLASAAAGNTMAPREVAFYQAVISALDALALPVANAKASFRTPDERTLRTIYQRFTEATALATH